MGLKANAKSGKLVGILLVKDQDDFVIMSEKGQSKRMNVTLISEQGRTATGNKLTKIEEGDSIVSATTLQLES